MPPQIDAPSPPARLRLRPASWWPAALALLVCACKSYGHFTLELDGVADMWPQGTVPVRLHASALDAIHPKEIVSFRQQGLDALDLHHLYVEQVGLVMQQPTSNPNFAFLRRVAVYAGAEGLPDVVIATGENLPAGSNLIGLDVADVDLAAYARKGTFHLFGAVQDADAPAQDTTVRLAVKVHAYVGEPGAALWQR